MDNSLDLYYFDGDRGEVFKLLYEVFKYQQFFTLSKTGNYKFLVYKLNNTVDLDFCLIGIVKIAKGVLIETCFPNQKGVFNRLWAVEPYMGQITYTEVDNKDLKNLRPIFYEDPNMRDMELHALPQDLALLIKLLKALLGQLPMHPKIIINKNNAKQLTSGIFS
jgi:hypothetical protein